ncbi:MAG TPA: FtsX-like permease family protein [Streptosporangiales bacterium]
MSPVTMLRLALAGSRTDGVRITLTAFGAAFATLGLLAIATVLSIQSPPVSPDGGITDAHYTNALLAEAGLRPGLSVALVLLTLPFLFFVAQCSRLGAPARDRRLAAYRLGGATPGQAAWIIAAETGVAAGLGMALGAAGYFVGRVLADRPGPEGMRTLPTDVLPPAWALVLVLAGLPVSVVALSLLLLRKVTVTPFGVVRRVRTRRVRPWPGVLLLVGLAGAGLLLPVRRLLQHHQVQLTGEPVILLFAAFVLLIAVGLVSGTGWLSFTGGRLLNRYARRPAGLLAGRRLVADPWQASRILSVLVIAVLFGSGAAAVHSAFDAQFRAEPGGYEDTGFYDHAFQLIDAAVLVVLVVAAAALLVMLAEQVVTRRRSLVALVAGGTPRSVLARAQLLQVLVPTVPVVLLAAASGTVAVLLLFDRSQGAVVPAPAVPVPWAELGVLVGGGIAAILGVSAIGLLFFRASTDIAELRTE